MRLGFKRMDGEEKMEGGGRRRRRRVGDDERTVGPANERAPSPIRVGSPCQIRVQIRQARGLNMLPLSEKGMPMIVGLSRRLLRSDTSRPRQPAQSYAFPTHMSSACPSLSTTALPIIV